MRKIAEVKIDHIDEEENAQYVDVFFSDDNMEEGTVACVVCLDTGKAFYRDNLFSAYNVVKEAVKEIQDSIENKVPKAVAIVKGGIITEVIGDTEIDLHVIDFDTDGESPEDLTEIEYEGSNNLVAPYIGDIFEEDAEKVSELIKSIGR